jgi:hypothetical protein
MAAAPSAGDVTGRPLILARRDRARTRCQQNSKESQRGGCQQAQQTAAFERMELLAMATDCGSGHGKDHPSELGSDGQGLYANNSGPLFFTFPTAFDTGRLTKSKRR